MACQFDLEAALPGETDDVGRFQKLELLLEGHRGVIDVHLRRDGGAPEICVHHDPAVLPLDQLQALVRSTGSAVSDRYRMHTWLVADMDAPQCAQVIEHALSRMAGVLSASVAYASERLVVEYDSRAVKPAQIEERVRAVGYALSEPEKAHTCIYHGAGGLSPKWRVPLSVAAAVLIAAGLLSEHVLHLPPLVAIGCFAGAIVTGGLFAMRGALQALRQGRVDIESLMVLAAVGAAVLGAWFEGAFLLLLFSVGHALEHRAMDRARKSLESLARLRPQVARVRRGQAVVEVKVEELKRGDRIVVRPGDRIPLDGVVREGETHVDQAAVTGESIPVPKRAGDEVYAATVNSDGAIEVEVTRLSSESLLSRVIKMVAQAEAQKSPTQRFAARLEKRFVPLVLVAAALTPVVFHLLGYELKEAVLRGVALLVAASPCALAISTPAAVLSAVAAAARGGVLVKGGAHLEELGRVKVVAFDKTGTLTEGRPRVVSVVPAAGESRDHVMAVAAAAESLSAHPLARAVVEAARTQGIAPLSASGLEAVHGKGLRAQVAGQPVAIGSLALFGEGVPEALRAEVERLEGAGQTTMVVHHADRYLGVVGLQDTLRGDAQKTVAALRSLGIGRCLMLSGDNARVAKALAAELGLDEVRAPLLPDGKVRELRALARDEGVAMVGDGVNDAPALAAASVGIAMGGAGADAALETADVVLMSDQLHRLPFALGLARKASSVVRQNLVISLGVSAALVVASLVGLAQVSHAVVLHEGSTLLVVANGLRLLGYRHDG